MSGGDTGSFALEGLEIDTEREDFVFGEDDIVAGLDESFGRLGAVRMDGGVNVTGPVYLGTFTFRASPDAEGVFDVAVDDGIHSFLRDSDGVEISSAPGDDNDCTTDTCESYECSNTNKSSGTPCDDGLYCTETDECDGNGTCVGTGNPCGVKAPKCCEDTDQCVDAQAQCPSGT